MWRDEATRANAAVLVERGARMVAPEDGDLACGERGEGRLADVATIAEEIRAAARRTRELSGVRVLVTAGGTREPVDPVRHIGNRASGKTGFAVAEEAARRGALVTLVTGATWLADPFGVEVVRIETAQEMRDAVVPAASATDVLVMTAAVADYRPSVSRPTKIPKTDGALVLELERTADILSEIADSDAAPLVVGFAAETGDLLARARQKLTAKRLDLVVANDVSDPGLGFASDRNRVVLVTGDSVEELPESSKRRIASVLLDRVTTMLAERAGRVGGG
jgi:phosphopantothenoylcysteine decarboxylase/phosphopantothenate--cysteine ligase